MGSFTFASSGAILDKAGAFVSSEVSNAMLLRFSDQAESYVNGIVRVNLITNFASLNSGFKFTVEDLASSHAGFSSCRHNMATYPSLAFAQTQLNTLRDDVTRLTEVIQDDKWKKAAGVT